MKNVLIPIVLLVVVYGCSSKSNPANPSSTYSLTFSKIIVELDTIPFQSDSRTWDYDMSQNQHQYQEDSGASTFIELDTIIFFKQDTTVILGKSDTTFVSTTKGNTYQHCSFCADPQRGLILLLWNDMQIYGFEGSYRLTSLWNLGLGNIPYTVNKNGQMYAEVVPSPTTPFLGTHYRMDSRDAGESYSVGSSFEMLRILAPTATSRLIIRSE